MTKIILQQDDAAPDSYLYFNKQMIELLGMSVDDFTSKSSEENHTDYLSEWIYDQYSLSISADDPYYTLREKSSKNGTKQRKNTRNS